MVSLCKCVVFSLYTMFGLISSRCVLALVALCWVLPLQELSAERDVFLGDSSMDNAVTYQYEDDDEERCPVLTKVNSSSFCKCNTISEIHCYNLDYIPQFIKITERPMSIYMSKQNITTLPAGSFQNLKVKKIVLDGNKIRNISSHTLHGIGDTLEEFSMADCDIDKIPGHFLQDVVALKRLYLWRNNLRKFPSSFFQDSRDLEEISLWGNRFILRENLFARMHELKKLDLEYNEIKTIPPNIFDSLVKLEVLKLGKNKIGTLEANKFQNLRQLKWLSLHSNGLTLISPRAFSGLRSLLVLDLHNCTINNVKDIKFDEMTSLTHLYLQGNHIRGLFGEDTFQGLSSLQYLDMSDNDIERIYRGLFNRLLSLRHLYLDFNKKLQKLPQSAFSESITLQTLSLVGCPIKCDCTPPSSYWMGQLSRAGSMVWGMCNQTTPAGIGDPNTYLRNGCAE